MRYLRNVPRRFKTNFREGDLLFYIIYLGCFSFSSSDVQFNIWLFLYPFQELKQLPGSLLLPHKSSAQCPPTNFPSMSFLRILILICVFVTLMNGPRIFPFLLDFKLLCCLPDYFWAINFPTLSDYQY